MPFIDKNWFLTSQKKEENVAFYQERKFKILYLIKQRVELPAPFSESVNSSELNQKHTRLDC